MVRDSPQVQGDRLVFVAGHKSDFFCKTAIFSYAWRFMEVLVYVTSVDKKDPFTFLSRVKKFWTASFTAAGALVVSNGFSVFIQHHKSAVQVSEVSKLLSRFTSEPWGRSNDTSADGHFTGRMVKVQEGHDQHSFALLPEQKRPSVF